MPITLDNDDALAILQTKLRRGGELHIITATHACLPGEGNSRGANGKGVPSTPEELARCAAHAAEHSHGSFSNPLADPAHYVAAEVLRIEGPDERGRVTAYADDGSWTLGYPAAVLSKLTEVAARTAREE